jgi:hypothetical protein
MQLSWKHIRENNTYWRFLQNHIYHSPILFLNGLGYTAVDFYEQAKHCQGLETNFTVALWAGPQMVF